MMMMMMIAVAMAMTMMTIMKMMMMVMVMVMVMMMMMMRMVMMMVEVVMLMVIFYLPQKGKGGIPDEAGPYWIGIGEVSVIIQLVLEISYCFSNLTCYHDLSQMIYAWQVLYKAHK